MLMNVHVFLRTIHLPDTGNCSRRVDSFSKVLHDSVVVGIPLREEGPTTFETVYVADTNGSEQFRVDFFLVVRRKKWRIKEITRKGDKKLRSFETLYKTFLLR